MFDIPARYLDHQSIYRAWRSYALLTIEREYWLGRAYGMYAYCLFCETQKCERIAQIIQSVYGIRCIFPRIMQRKWVKGQCLEESHQWLPGYIFLYSEEPIVPYFPVAGIIRWLERSELKGRDYAFAETLYQQNGVMGTIRLAEVGDRCTIADPVWEKMSGTIIKLDRSRKRCCIEFEFDKTKRSVWVGYELIRPDTTEDGEAGERTD